MERGARTGKKALAFAKAGGWQQAARMIAAQVRGGRLERVYVLPSTELITQFDDFVKYL